MDNKSSAEPHGVVTPRQSSSPETLNNASRPSQPESEHPSLSKRSSIVRFASDTLAESPSMSRRRTQADVDEIIPIRSADGHPDRNYKTTDSPEQTPTSDIAQDGTVGWGEPEEKQSWFRKMTDKYGSVTLENKGSVARDHLALERTFLAWLRTSLAFASIGIAVTQLFRLNVSSQDQTKSMAPRSTDPSTLPLSPLLGHGLAPELIPFLQQLVASVVPPAQQMPKRETLLDQLLFMPPQELALPEHLHTLAFNNHAAAKLRRVGKPLGATFIGVSILVLLVGFHRYFESQYWIIRGKFPASRGSISFVGLIAGALIVASFVVVLVVAPISYQKK